MGPGQRRQAVGERRREAARRKGRGFMVAWRVVEGRVRGKRGEGK
jgi:hypothetical protein